MRTAWDIDPEFAATQPRIVLYKVAEPFAFGSVLICLLIGLGFPLFASYGFFPTAMRMMVDVPCPTSATFPVEFSCSGEMHCASANLRVPAACIYGGRSLICTLSKSNGLGASVDTCTPVPKPMGTEKSGTSLPYGLIPGKPPTDLPRFQPAFCKTSSIERSRNIESS